MKKKILKFAFITAAMIFNSCSYSQTNSSEDQIIKTLKEFYTSYITENSKAPGDAKSIEAVKRKYCTTKLLSKIKEEELDYDPILNAQDSDIKWLETLSIVKDANQKNVYIVSYADSFSKDKKFIKLVMTSEKGQFMIDDIL